SFEAAARASGALRVAGVDEVGRGPLAGPVTAAAVRLDLDRIPAGLDDSKRLRAERRTELAAILLATADVSVGHASVEEIDSLNILRATHLAMTRAIAGLAEPPDHLLIDGNQLPKGLTIRAESVVKGDARVLSIAAASIVAKVARDRIMADLARDWPGYGWDGNAGYPTPGHLAALSRLGPTPHHRRSFRPVHNILYPDQSVTR
ncbi:MAG: ribonuclease HII, partial [Mangrovicoccus sp.]|nr:ribonuclease HII [Mangrovicoccus sp.]